MGLQALWRKNRACRSHERVTRLVSLQSDMYEYSMEHHTDWVNDIVLVNAGKHSKREPIGPPSMMIDSDISSPVGVERCHDQTMECTERHVYVDVAHA